MPSEISLNSTVEVSSQKKQKLDSVWILSLYGTAIGAGTLFLPIDAGLSGFGPLVILAMLAFPMTYFSHQALCRFVLSGSAEGNITDVVEEHFGVNAGKILTVLYFFSVMPILLLYSVAITNTAQSFLNNQLGVYTPHRALLAAILILTLMGIIRLGKRVILKSLNILVYPFIASLVTLSLFLMPHWNDALLQSSLAVPTGTNSLFTIWLALPVMIFAFNHSAIISSFAIDQKKRFGTSADQNSSWVLQHSHILMVVTVMFFVFSCVFSLSPSELLEAKQQNISILSYLANHFNNPVIAYIAPIIAFIAIAKSFLGHYMGASEGLEGILIKTLPSWEKRCPKSKQRLLDGFFIVICWLTATYNPNILKMIEMLAGPITAILLFLMPMYAITTVPRLKKYQKPFINTFIFSIGIIGLSAIFYGIWESFFG